MSRKNSKLKITNKKYTKQKKNMKQKRSRTQKGGRKQKRSRTQKGGRKQKISKIQKGGSTPTGKGPPPRPPKTNVVELYAEKYMHPKMDVRSKFGKEVGPSTAEVKVKFNEEFPGMKPEVIKTRIRGEMKDLRIEEPYNNLTLDDVIDYSFVMYSNMMGYGKDKVTALLTLEERGRHDLIKKILEKNPDSVNHALLDLAKDGEFDDLKTILLKYPDFVNKKTTPPRYSILKQAIYWSSIESVKNEYGSIRMIEWLFTFTKDFTEDFATMNDEEKRSIYEYAQSLTFNLLENQQNLLELLQPFSPQ